MTARERNDMVDAGIRLGSSSSCCRINAAASSVGQLVMAAADPKADSWQAWRDAVKAQIAQQPKAHSLEKGGLHYTFYPHPSDGLVAVYHTVGSRGTRVEVPTEEARQLYARLVKGGFQPW